MNGALEFAAASSVIAVLRGEALGRNCDGLRCG